MVIRKFVMCVLIGVLLLTVVSAVAVSPGSTGFIGVEKFEPGEEYSYSMSFFNRAAQAGQVTRFEVTVIDDSGLAEEVTVSPSSFETVGTSPQRVTFKFKAADMKNLEPGDHALFVKGAEISKPEGGIGVSALTAVMWSLRISVPYEEAFAKVSLDFGDELVRSRSVPIKISINNIGGKDLIGAHGYLEIFSPKNEALANLSFSEIGPINAQGQGEVLLNWEASGLDLGEYRFLATVNYNEDRTSRSQKIHKTMYDTFMTIDSLSPHSVKQGEISQVLVNIRSFWHSTVLYTATLRLKDQSGETLEEFNHESGISKNAGDSFEVSIDTRKLDAGEYTLEVALSYLGKTAKKLFAFSILPSEAAVQIVDSQVGSQYNNGVMFMMLGSLILLVIILIVVIVLRMPRVNKKTKGNKKGRKRISKINE
jgi:hypothetical protein